MADPLIPTLLPYYIGDWTFINTTSPPPATGQMRLNSGGQTNATLIYIHRITANGNDATSTLTGIAPGHVIRLQDKDDQTKWQSYVATAAAVAKTDYWDIPVTWLNGGAVLPQQRITFEVIGVRVSPTGNSVTASVGNAVVDLRTHARINVDGFALQASTSAAAVTGYIFLPDQAYPSDTPAGFSPGMTLRQYYVGQAITGFLASGGPIGNLIGKGAELCFRVADSMIEFETRHFGPPRTTTPPVPAPPTGISTPPGQANITVPIEEALAMQKRDAAA